MANLLDGWLKVDLGEGAFYALLGFVFVLVGILVLVAIFTLLGAVMKRLNEKQTKKSAEEVPAADLTEKTEDGISPETIAAITAAIMCYYQKENVKCDFVVRRIKRIERSQDHA